MIFADLGFLLFQVSRDLVVLLMLKYSSRLRFWMVHFLNLVFEKHSTDVVAGPMLSHVVDFVV